MDHSANRPDVGQRAAAQLSTQRAAVAQEVTARLYAETPALLDRYGEVGREKCLQDMGYTVDHLVPAVEIGEPALFAEYVRWLDDLLRTRNVETDEIVRCLRLMVSVAHERLAADEAEAVAMCLQAGLAVLNDTDA
jgi:hypothetical protein